MIFNCPDCQAGHSVPVSMIPNGGLDMDCRRCGEPFTVDPPPSNSIIPTEPTGLPGEADPDDEDLDDEGDPTLAGLEEPDDTTADKSILPEKTNVGPPPLPESTRVGVANPLDDSVDERPLIGPGGPAYDPADYVSSETDALLPTEKRPQLHDRPTMPITTDHVPLGPDEEGVDPERDDTIRFGVEDTPAPRPSVESTPDLDLSSEDREFVDPSEVVRDRPFGNSNVYERVAAGISVPEESIQPISLPSIQLEPPPTPTPFTSAADVLNKAPLALKVGMIVFPITLGIMLVVNATTAEAPTEDPPIEIPVAKDPPPARGLTKVADIPKTPDVAAPEPRENRQEIDPTPVLAEDKPAPEGFLFVQVDNARLRAEASIRAPTSGRLRIGSLVKIYDQIEDWSLVIGGDRGPAGFISNKLLAERKPTALLAQEQAFSRCSVAEGYDQSDCLYSSKQQEQTCLDRCGAVNAGDERQRLRCAQVCSIAFDNCARSCNVPPKRKRRRRRR